jgi:hypothetical protein
VIEKSPSVSGGDFLFGGSSGIFQLVALLIQDQLPAKQTTERRIFPEFDEPEKYRLYFLRKMRLI